MQTQKGRRLSLPQLIHRHIARNGPISIAEYMSLALAHPEFGYYMRKDPIGRQGDFITAPEISQIFGELIGLWLAEQWRVMGKPNPCLLVELGPGRGTLMADILRASRHVQGFRDAISVHLVETSPALKQKQWNTLAGKHPNLQWYNHVDDLPDGPLLVVANEFFDALPIRQFLRKDTAWHERMVSSKPDKSLEFVLGDDTNGILIPDHAQKSDFYELCEPALDILRILATRIKKDGGVAVFIDYGYEQGYADTLQALREHRHANVLEDPGSADLTAHVDFGALKQLALQEGLSVFGTRPQGAFLGALGAIPRAVRLCEGIAPEEQAKIMSGLERLISPERMGELFKVLCVAHAHYPKPEGL